MSKFSVTQDEKCSFFPKLDARDAVLVVCQVICAAVVVVTTSEGFSLYA